MPLCISETGTRSDLKVNLGYNWTTSRLHSKFQVIPMAAAPLRVIRILVALESFRKKIFFQKDSSAKILKYLLTEFAKRYADITVQKLIEVCMDCYMYQGLII